MGVKRCPHGKLKCNCVECSPCPHGKLKRNCVECNICPHGKMSDDATNPKGTTSLSDKRIDRTIKIST